MRFKAVQLADAIRAYPVHYGKAWGVFRDYKRVVEKAGASILDEALRDQSALRGLDNRHLPCIIRIEMVARPACRMALDRVIPVVSLAPRLDSRKALDGVIF